MPRVLWYGDVGGTTGFARVTHAIANRLVDKGHDVHVLGLNYNGDWSPETDRLKIYKADNRAANDDWGSRRIVEVIERVDPDAVVFLHDPAALIQMLFQNPYDQARVLLTHAPVIAYLPVDGYDYPSQWVEILTTYTNVVAMSEHGQRTFPGSKLVYHGIEPDQFWPVSPERPIDALTTKAECKAALGHDPDKVLVLRVDANSGRKDYAATIHALAPFLDAHEDVEAHFHAAVDPRIPGVNIPVLLGRYDIEDRVTVTDPARDPWPTEKLNILYNAADIFVTTSRGEGFGLTIAEALSCAVPVIGQNASAIPEIVGTGGFLLQPDRRLTTPAGQDLCLADVEAFTKALETLYSDADARVRLGQAGRDHVSTLSWDYAADRFNDFICAAARWRTSTEAN